MKNIKKNFIWNSIGLTLYGFVSLFLLIFVKYINGMNDSGVFSYAYSICTLFFYISLYFNRTYQISNYNDNKTFNQYFSFRCLSVFISFILIFIFCLISKFDIFKTSVILFLMLFRSIDALSDTFYGYLQENNQLYKVGISYTCKSILSIIVFLLVDLLSKNILISIIGMNIVNILFLVFYDYKNVIKLNIKKIEFDFSNKKLILKEAFPVFIFSFLSIFLANAEKYVIVYYASNEIQSIFAILIMPATVLSLIGSYLITPFVASLNNLKKELNYKKFNNMTLKILIILLFFGFLGVIFCYYLGIPILNLIFKLDLIEYKFDFIIIIIASILCALSMILSNILTILKNNISQIVFYLISSIIAIISCIIFIKNDIIRGASLSYLLSYVICFFCYIISYVFIIKRKCLNEKKQ